MIRNLKMPSFTEETVLEARGYRFIAGVDEVGRGALAGPVMAAAVILPRKLDTHWLSMVNDSKQLSPAKREFLYQNIYGVAIAVGIGLAYHEVIDNDGIVKATKLAMKLAIDRLTPPADSLLIDYISLPEVSLPQKGIKKGDIRCLSIACASIIAKVTRDRLMVELDAKYPGYKLGKHKGYGTREHLACLKRLGPSPIHRQSFRPVRELL